MGLKGSCLCGEISYEIDSVDMPIVHCHCQTCRKAHAASFAATAGVKRDIYVDRLRIAPFLQTLWFSFGRREACAATRNCSGSYFGR